MKRSLTRIERLTSQRDFRRVFGTGRRVGGFGAKLIYRENNSNISRFAVCPVRAYGSAVRRNRAKRICREIFRHMKHRVLPGYDIVMVTYPGHDTYRELGRAFVTLTERAGLLEPER